MTFDPAVVRLGRPFARHDPRTLKLGRYLDLTKLPPAPAAIDYGAKISDWKMLANDKLGDCTCAGLLHIFMLWTSQTGRIFNCGDADAVKLYELLCGYDPKDPTSDQGGILLDILKAWRKSPIMGLALGGYVSIDPKNWEQIKLAHFLFGSLYIGVNLPLSAQKEKIWKDTKDVPGGWGGHCVMSVAYRDGKSCFKPPILTVGTWGTTQDMTAAWAAKYVDEIWAPVSPSWTGASGNAPNGFNIGQLLADQAALAA